MRHLLHAALVLAATAGAAVAQPGAPTPGQLRPAPMDDAPVEVVSGNPVVSAHVVRVADALARCAPTGTTVTARVRISWDAKGRTKAIAIAGGRATFQRCARKALAGKLPIARRRAGTGAVAILVRGTAPVAPTPTPTPRPIADALHGCTVDADCTLHFRSHACVQGDPVAINAAAIATARKVYPVERLDCGMGGPSYDKLRASVDGRWSARCEQSRCAVVDAGPQPYGPSL